MFKTVLQVLAIYLVIFTQMLDNSVANLSLVKMAPDLGMDIYHASWIMTSFGTGLAMSFPLISYFSRRFAPDTLFLVANISFILSSLGCALAVGVVDFISYRVLQGLASGFVVILSQSMLFKLMGEKNRGLTVAVWTSAISLAPALGPVIGAFVTEALGWRWLFLINVPLISVCLLITFDTLKLSLKQNKSAKMNAPAIISYILAVGCMQYALDFGERQGWLDSQSIRLALVLMVLFGFGFMLFNQKKDKQVFDFSVFRDNNYAFATTVICVGNGLLFASLVVLPVWLQVDYAMPILDAGVIVAVGSGLAALLSPLAGKYIKPSYYFAASLLSLAFSAISFVMMSQFSLDSTTEQLVSARLVAGLGLALFSVPLTALSLSTLPAEALINANAINVCLRVLSSNFCVSVGFAALRQQKDRAYEEMVANTDRFTVQYYSEQPFELHDLVARFADTQAMSEIFIVTAIVFVLLLLFLMPLAFKREAREKRRS